MQLVESEVRQQVDSVSLPRWLAFDRTLATGRFTDRALAGREQLIEDTISSQNLTKTSQTQRLFPQCLEYPAEPTKLLQKGRFKEGWRLYEHGLGLLQKARNVGNARLNHIGF